MANEITEPIAPDTLDPKPFASLAGDWKDDDGPATDEYFEAADLGPIEYDKLLVDTSKSIPGINRIVSRSLPMTANEPLQFLAADPNRKNLSIVLDVDNNYSVQFGSEKSDTYGAARLWAQGSVGTTKVPQVYDFPGYTGAVWLRASNDLSDGSVNVFAITE